MLRQLCSVALTAPIRLRDYQSDAIDKVLNSLKNGVRRPAVVLATGGGKTVVMSHLIPKIQSQNEAKKTLVLAHKEELVRQIAQTLRRVNPDLEVEVDMQKQKPSSSADVIVGSVPSLVRLTRLNWYNPKEFKAIILDECHHAAASSWTKILHHFGALNDDLELAVVGFTATLERADGASLGEIFQEVAYERSLLTMIEQKELCDAQFLSIQLDMNLSNVSLFAGDYKQGELDKHVNTKDVNLQLSRAYKKIKNQLGLKSTLIFCVTVEHCKTLCGVLQAQGVNAQYVSGDTVRHERRAILQDFKDGLIEVLCNVLVFTEGTDIPNIDSLILARPTRSRPLLTQMIGRGLRLHQGKEQCHIIDMVDATDLGILSVPILFGLPQSHKIDRKSFKDLEQDKQEYEELRAAAERNSIMKDILDNTNRDKNWDVKLEKKGGFAELMKLQEAETESIHKFRDTLLKDPYDWVRIEYNVWGTKGKYDYQYWIIEMPNHELDQCSLYVLELATRKQIIASNFKCQRKTKLLINTGKLPYLLGIVRQSNGFKSFNRVKPATDKQKALISKIFSTKVRNVFGTDGHKAFEHRIQVMDQNEVSALMVASSYSMNCWYVYKKLKMMVEDGKAQNTSVEGDNVWVNES